MNDEPTEEKKSPVPLSANARRVLGVLVEKAKTTPDNYPLSLAGLISGCNQKSNRAPKMDLDDEDALLALDELRELGAAREVQGSGRVTKYRHAAYEWLDVDSPGASVMTELLLRGPQTLGEIRTRASRMYAARGLEGGPGSGRYTDRKRIGRGSHASGSRSDVRSHAVPAPRTPVPGSKNREASRCRRTDANEAKSWSTSCSNVSMTSTSESTRSRNGSPSWRS